MNNIKSEIYVRFTGDTEVMSESPKLSRNMASRMKCSRS